MVNLSRININLETASTAVIRRSHFYAMLAWQIKAILCEWQKDSIVCKMKAGRSMNGLPVLFILI